MGISENFLVNTNSFDPIIKALISRSEHPEKISDTMLKEMGYDNPSDLLVIHILQGLDIINQDRTPSELYFKMVDPKQTKDAIAEGIINGYQELFERNYEVHKMLPGELQTELTDYFGDKKTDLIIKYIANTFYKLITYAGYQKVELTRDNYFRKKAGISEADENTSEPENNGTSSPDFEGVLNQKQAGSRSVEEVLFGDKKSEENTREDKKPEIEQPAKETEIEDTVEGTDKETSDIKESNIDSDTDSDTTTPAHKNLSLSNLNTSNKRVQKAVIKKAELQYKLEYFKEALASTEEIIAYFEESGEELLENAVADAIIRRVDLLKKLKKNDELLPALDEVIGRFSNSEKKKYYEHASKAMLLKAELLDSDDFDKKDLLSLYNAIIKRLGHSTDPSLKEKIDSIFIQRLKLLVRSGDRAELLDALEESINRFKHSEQLKKYLEEAMFRKAELLEEMDRNEEALEAYNDFLNEFGNTIKM